MVYLLWMKISILCFCSQSSIGSWQIRFFGSALRLKLLLWAYKFQHFCLIPSRMIESRPQIACECYGGTAPTFISFWNYGVCYKGSSAIVLSPLHLIRKMAYCCVLCCRNISYTSEAVTNEKLWQSSKVCLFLINSEIDSAEPILF